MQMNTEEWSYLERWEKEQAELARQREEGEVFDVNQKEIRTIDDIRDATLNRRSRCHRFCKEPECIIRRYRMHYYRLGYPPALHCIINGDRWMPTQTTIRKYFKSADNLLKAAGFADYHFEQGSISAVPDQKPLTELQERYLRDLRSTSSIEKSHATGELYQPSAWDKKRFEEQQFSDQANLLTDIEMYEIISRVAHRQEDVIHDYWSITIRREVYSKTRSKLEYWREVRKLEDLIRRDEEGMAKIQSELEQSGERNLSLRAEFIKLRDKADEKREELRRIKEDFADELKARNKTIEHYVRLARSELALQYSQEEAKRSE